MCIARLSADVEQQGDRIDVCSEAKLWGTFPARGLQQWRKGQGTIEYFISPRERYEAYTVTLSSDVVVVVVNSPVGFKTSANQPRFAVHFKKDQTLKPQTAHALAQMILAAQRAMSAMPQNEEE
jgi:hypothetical protein